MSEGSVMHIKPRKSVRFSVGVEKELSETFEKFIKKHQDYESASKEEVPSIAVIPPSDVNDSEKTLQQSKSKEGFLEHLLEVDNIENGHTQHSDQAVDDEDRILPQDNTLNTQSSFIETRNYLAEKGIVITPTSPHKQTLYVVRGDRILGSKDILTNSGDEFELNQIENPTAVSSPTGALSNPSENSPASINKMSYTVGGYTQASPPSSSRMLQEELHQLNERFSSYVQRVRQLGEQANIVDTSAFLKSTKSLEQEINNLKNLYEQELQKLRDEMDALSKDKTSFQVQSNKHQQVAAELQERVSGEVDKNRKLIDEINNLQRKIGQLEAELHGSTNQNTEMPTDSNNIQRTIENLRRENENLKKRCECEQIARQQAEDRLQQMMKKLEFNEQVCHQQLKDLSERNDAAAATIMALEAKVRELTKSESSISEMLKQVREVAENELNRYKMETEAQQFRDISGLKAQMEQDASTIENLQTENCRLQERNDELTAKICKLEGQISSQECQRQTFEECVRRDRSQAAENIRRLETKLRQVQDLLFAKIQEVSDNRESSVPLKSEIKALKILLEEEERRLTHSLTSPPKPCENNFSPSPLPSPPRLGETNKPLSPRSRSNSLPTPLPNTLATTTSVSQPVDTYSYMPDYLSSPTFAPITSDSMLPDRRYNIYSNNPGVQPGYDQDFSSAYMSMFVDPNEPVVSAESSARYMYEQTPNETRILMDQSPQVSPKESDPDTGTNSKGTRAKSAPAYASARTGANLVPSSLGTGKDYFDEMFHDLQRDTLYTSVRPKSSPADRRPYSSTTHDYTTSTSSAVGDIKILEVNQDGKFIRLFNDGAQEIEIGGYMIQQNVGGHPVAVYRFPPRVKFAGNTTITVHSGMNDVQMHQPPKDFVWKEQQKWGTGPECTTILCRPSGQAIAWSTAAHRFARNPCEDMPKGHSVGSLNSDRSAGEDERLMEVSMDRTQQEPVYLKREKQQRPTLTPARHPHGTSVNIPTHPQTGQPRPLVFGNDNSTVSRQSRSQTMRPDPIPGQPYSGASAQRMGSAPLRKYAAAGTVKGTGSIANRSNLIPGQTSPPPSPFMKPHLRNTVGIEQVKSQHNVNFMPPMPRPPLFSAW